MAQCWPSKCIKTYKQITERLTSWRTRIHKERVLADVRWLTRRGYEFSVNGSPRDCGAAVAWIKRRFCAASKSTKPVYQQILSIVHQKDDRQTSVTHKRGCKSSVDLYARKTLTLSISRKIKPHYKMSRRDVDITAHQSDSEFVCASLCIRGRWKRENWKSWENKNRCNFKHVRFDSINDHFNVVNSNITYFVILRRDICMICEV